MNDIDAYQNAAIRTAADSGDNTFDVLILAIGLCGEAGEVGEHLKKVYGHGHVLDRQKVLDELGDVLWYVANLAYRTDIKLSEVLQRNVDKLLARYPDGFSTERSVNR